MREMSDKIDNCIDKRITCIIEDYKALKGEISRRSDLQRFALLAYGGIIALSLKFNEQANFYDFQIILIWLTSSLAYFFYFAEDDFIKRLARIAYFNNWLFTYLLESEEDYTKLYSESLESKFKEYNTKEKRNQKHITLKDVVFPSESPSIVDIIETKESKRKAEIINVSFLSFYLIILPAIITFYYFIINSNSVKPCVSVFYFVIIAFSFVANVCTSIHLHKTNTSKYL